MTALLATYWPLFLAAADLLGAALASLHALLKKRETHSVIGWVGLIWLAPFIGWILYFCFGINRIQRRGCEVSQKLQKVPAETASLCLWQRGSSHAMSKPPRP